MPHDIRPRLVLALLLGLLTVPGPTAFSAAAIAPAAAACVATGHLISGPTLNRDPNGALLAVAAAGPGDVWAVGFSGIMGSTMIAHWTGTAWEQVASPGESYANAILSALAVINPRDIWAVGFYNEPAQPLLEHWDGAAWAIRAAPPQARGVELNQVAASGPSDVWITGHTTATGEGRVFHWDGQAWQETPVPHPPGLRVKWAGLVAPAAAQAWMVGGGYDSSDDETTALLAHWDGRTWATQGIAVLPTGTHFTAIAAHGPQDVWAVGTLYLTSGPSATALPSPLPAGDAGARSRTVFVHWDGQQWSPVPAPNDYEIHSLTVVSPTEAWAGGTDVHDSGERWGLLHWDGAQWTRVAIIGGNVADYHSQLSGVAAEGPNDVWAVGSGGVWGWEPLLSLVHIFRDCAVPTAPAPDPQDPAITYFPATGHTLRGLFRAYWQAHGGLAQFGYPITEEFPEKNATDGRVYTVQYFERNRFEAHPENAGTPYEVLLGLLGRTMTTRPPGEWGETFQAEAFRPLRQGPAGARFFPASGHSLAPEFRAYWEGRGGLAVYGYPISEGFQETSPTDGQTYLVQYFERNRLELHPELPPAYRVSLGLLGVDLLRSRGWVP
ncbi:MAG TPA: hypothetical protein VKY74_10240 [Chloroflexia bacterium]|nr:hypothetical protein [Chloroflexia bacterium]